MTAQGGSSLAKQLTSVLPRMRSARARTTGGQLTMRIPADDLDGAFGEARDEVLRWMQDRAGRSLSAEAWHGAEFELAGAGPPRAEAALARDVGTSQTTLSPAETAA